MASCSSVLGLVLLLLTALAAIIAAGTSFWIVSTDGHAGLWQQCDKSENCSFIDVKSTTLPKWFNPVRVVIAVSVANSFVALLVAMMYMCCACCRNSIRGVQFLVLVLVLGCLELSCSVVVYAAKHQDTSFYTAALSDAHLGWSFYLAAAAALGFILSIFFYVCETANSRSGREEYQPLKPTTTGYQTIPPTNQA